MYKQSLYKIIEPIKLNTIKRLNKKKAWKYGYNKEHDVVVISKDGTIGDVYSIQNLKIALPKTPKNVHKFEHDKWQVTPYPKELNRIKTIFDWREYPQDFKNKYIEYIEDEFTKRERPLARAGSFVSQTGAPSTSNCAHTPETVTANGSLPD